MWSRYMYMALQMYVISDVTVVVRHLYLFGYVLVVYSASHKEREK